MPLFRRLLIDGFVLLTFSLIQWQLVRWALQVPGWQTHHRLIRRLGIASVLFIAAGMILPFQEASLYVPVFLVAWLQGLAMLWAFATLGFLVVAFLWRQVPRPQMERRRFLQTAAAASFLAPLAVEGYGMFIERENFEVREVNLPVVNLPKDLQGLRILQLTDIHMSEFLSERDFARVVDLGNEQKAHLALVTGDLITRYRDPLDACLQQLKRVKADAGILGCLGNHEVYAAAEEYTTEQGARLGMDFLRKRSRQLRFGNAVLNVTGFDYQPMKAPYLVGGERFVLRQPNTVNMLLSHNPDVFPVAERQGYDTVIGGHTHGGQVTVEILSQYINPARMYTPYVSGLYRRETASLYVSRGIGTIALPVRLNTRPEITVLTLCAS